MSAEEYLAISSSGRVVGGPFRYYEDAHRLAMMNGGHVQFLAAKEGDPSAMGESSEARESYGAHLSWKLSGSSYIAHGAGGSVYEIRATVLRGRQKRPSVGWTLSVDGKQVDAARVAEDLMLKADEMELGARERAPLVHEAGERVPVVHEGKTDSIAIVERSPEFASTGTVINSAGDVWALVSERYRKSGVEVFEVLLLNLRSELLGSPVQVATGQRDRVAIDIEQVVAPIVKASGAGCVAVILVHLHPSGHATPSEADKRLTASVKSAMKVATPNTTLVDHVVVAPRSKGGEYYSFTENKTFRVK